MRIWDLKIGFKAKNDLCSNTCFQRSVWNIILFSDGVAVGEENDNIVPMTLDQRGPTKDILLST